MDSNIMPIDYCTVCQIHMQAVENILDDQTINPEHLPQLQERGCG